MKEKNVVGFIKIGNDAFKTFKLDGQPPLTTFLRFSAGGRLYVNDWPFNGVLSRLTFNSNVGAYLAKVEEVTKLV